MSRIKGSYLHPNVCKRMDLMLGYMVEFIGESNHARSGESFPLFPL